MLSQGSAAGIRRSSSIQVKTKIRDQKEILQMVFDPVDEGNSHGAYNCAVRAISFWSASSEVLNGPIPVSVSVERATSGLRLFEEAVLSEPVWSAIASGPPDCAS